MKTILSRLALPFVIVVPLSAALWFGAKRDESRESLEKLGPVFSAADRLPIRAERHLISHGEGEVLESVHRIYRNPPGQQRVVFREFRRNGKRVDAPGWWKGFLRMGEASQKKGGREMFGELAGMAGWDLPQQGRLFFSSSGGLPFGELRLLCANYGVTPGGEATVAGRATDLLEIRPRTIGRPWYRIAADRENRYPLRIEVFGLDGRPLSTTELAEVEFSPSFAAGTFPEKCEPPEERFLERIGLRRMAVPLSEAPKKVCFGVALPSQLPAGFELQESGVVTAGRLIQLVHATYTDGAATIFLVECSRKGLLWKLLQPAMEDSKEASPASGRRRVYKFTDRMGTALLSEVGGTAILIAGNIDAAELLKMMQSVEEREPVSDIKKETRS